MKLLSMVGLAILALFSQGVVAQVVKTDPSKTFPQVTGQVDAMIEHNNVLYIGGVFTQVGSTNVSNLAAIDLTNGSVINWSPKPDADVLTLLVVGNTLYVGGRFNTMGSSTRQSMASFDLSNGRALTSWNPQCVDNANNFFGDRVYDFEVLGNTLYAAGGFSRIDSTPRGGLASFDLANLGTNNGLTSWDPNLGGGLEILGIFGAQGMEIVNNMVVIHGGWEYCGGKHMDDGSASPHATYSNTNGMLAFSPNGTGARIATFEPIVDTVNSMASAGNTIYISGLINSVGGGGTSVSVDSFAELDATVNTTTTNPATSFDPNFDDRSFGLSIDNGILVATGSFAQIGSTNAFNAGAIDLATGAALPWGASIPGALSNLIVGNKIYVGGNFTQVNSSAHTGLAVFDVTPDLLISTATPLASGNHQQAFSQQFASTGGGAPYTWTATGLPTNWNISSAGLLTAAAGDVFTGSHSFNVSVTGNLGQVDTVNFNVDIIAPTLAITTSSTLPAGTDGISYNATLAATGGQASYFWLVATGSNLPTGWTLATSTGLLAAVGSNVATGSYSFEVEISDGFQTDSRTFNVSIQAAGAPLVISNPATLPAGTHGQAYSYQMTATGGISSYNWIVNAGTALPTNWSINSSTGLITAAGVDVVAGSYNFTVEVSDGSSTDQLAVSLTVEYPALVISTGTLPQGTEALAYAASLDAAGGSGSGYNWTIVSGALPTGIVGIPASGQSIGLTGSASLEGTYNFTVQLTDGASNSVTKNFSITINAAVSIAPTPIPGGSSGGGCFVSGNSTTGLLFVVILGLLALATRRRTEA